MYYKSVIFLCILFASAPLFSRDIDSLKLSADQNRYNLNHHLYLFEDTSAELGIDEILTKDKIFIKNERDYPEFGFTRSAVWGYFVLNSPLSSDSTMNLLFDFPLLDEIDVYIISETGMEHFASGSKTFILKNNISYRQNIIPFKIKKGETISIYFRVVTTDTLEIPLHLYTDSGLVQYYYSNMLVLGMYYGIILVMVLYNLFVYISARDKSYLYYVIMIAFIGLLLFSNDGLTKQFFYFIDLKWLKRLDGFVGVVCIFSAMQFSIEFLNLKKHSPFYYKIFQLISVLSILHFVHIYFDFYNGVQFAMITALTGSLLCIAAGLHLYKEYVPARFYLFAMTFSMTGTIFFTLKSLNVYFPFITQYGLQIGHVAEVTLLSFALANRIRLLEDEKAEILYKGLQREKVYLENKFRMEFMHVRNERMEKDLDVARSIQLRMISEGLYERHILTLYYPMEKLGGDMVDIFPLSDKLTGIFVGDVSGHGISASLLTVLIKSFITGKLQDLEVKTEKSDLFYPSNLLKALNRYLLPHLENEFVCSFYAVYDHSLRILKYRGAGHPPPIIFSPGYDNNAEISFLKMKTQFYPIGTYFENSKDMSGEGDNYIELNKGSRLLIYSDGLFDAMNYSYENSSEGIKSFSNTFLYENMLNCFKFSLLEWVENLSVGLLENRDRWTVEDDISAVFLDVKELSG